MPNVDIMEKIYENKDSFLKKRYKTLILKRIPKNKHIALPIINVPIELPLIIILVVGGTKYRRMLPFVNIAIKNNIIIKK
jgi:hypothetical protein